MRMSIKNLHEEKRAMKKQKKVTAVLLLGVLAISGCGAADDIQEAAQEQMEWTEENDARDNGMSAEEALEKEVGDILASEDENVLMVKNGTNSNYPDVTYGEAFETYFGTPEWRYFKGTQEGPDDDGDGKSDYTNDDIDVVEFTGYCTYADVEVKALIQFVLDTDAGTFEAQYLSFNEVPQSGLQLGALLESVFETYAQEHGLTGAQGTDNSSQQQTETDLVYPEDMNHGVKQIDPLEVAGYYEGALCCTADISIYSSPEDSSVGSANIYVDESVDGYGGCSYEGEIIELDTNVYSVQNDQGQTVLLGVYYDADGISPCLELWIDNQYVDVLYIQEHYES